MRAHRASRLACPTARSAGEAGGGRRAALRHVQVATAEHRPADPAGHRTTVERPDVALPAASQAALTQHVTPERLRCPAPTPSVGGQPGSAATVVSVGRVSAGAGTVVVVSAGAVVDVLEVAAGSWGMATTGGATGTWRSSPVTGSYS